MFYVNQKVVCIDDRWTMALTLRGRIKRWLLGHDVDPVKGRIYTIRDIYLKYGATWLRFHELHNPEGLGLSEPRYKSIAFRPLIERKTDISALEALLTGRSIKVDA